MSDPNEMNSNALCMAANGGHTQCVALLIPVSRPDDLCVALARALTRGHSGCVELLYPVSDPHKTLAILKYVRKNGGNPHGIAELEQRIAHDKQRAVLEQAVSGNRAAVSKAKRI